MQMRPAWKILLFAAFFSVSNSQMAGRYTGDFIVELMSNACTLIYYLMVNGDVVEN